ncbi:MAG TPA: SDR family NAD(P)-dependent oxidoreductase [Xanthobacteraceae bacterium]|nr:SDR family NAD(P)-dependent oxidoreductase [Xanthobacteraceae bacterium]
MLIEFSNRRVIVAGAARGIGRAIVTAFAERGATVWAGDLLTEEIAPLAGRSGKGVAHTAHLDVTDPVSIDRFVATAAGDGAIDILVYVAGGVRGQTAQPIEGVSPQDWDAIVDANLTGAFLCARAVAPGMKRAGRGRIVTISSRAGLVTSLTGIASYAAAKHGQVGLVKQLAQELGPFGINVNSVAPGFMATSPDYERQWASYSPEFRAAFVERIAMRRMGTPEDIAYAAMFLASDYASWITGQVLPVTGSPLV